jgi:molybdopterin-guanine dinucleotide biosynthesis protein A
MLEGRTLLQRAVDATSPLADAYVIVTAKGQALPEIDSEVLVHTVEDAYTDTGALGGIYTGLLALGNSPGAALVVACDMPLLQPALLRELVRLAPGHDAVVPMLNGLPEPLCAVYTMACAGPARRLLDRGSYKVTGLLDEVNALRMTEEQWRAFDPDGLSFLNVNREEDLDFVKELISQRMDNG